MKTNDSKSTLLDARDLARYSRHILLPEIGREGQEKLAAARVLVVGAGGLGSPVALYLTAAGAGTLGLADFDAVEEHNLQRQILHDTGSVGKLKLDSAMRRLKALNPRVRLELHREGITPQNAVEIFGQYDVIVDGCDNFPVRYLNNDAAFFSRVPLVYGSLFRFEGQVSFFDPAAGGPCYRCLFPEPPAPGTVPNCAEAGVFGALCGVVGSLQAMEAIKYLTKVGETLAGQLLVVDSLSANFRKLRLKKDSGCPLCGNSPAIRRIDPDVYRFSCDPEGETVMNEENYPLEIDVDEARRLFEKGEAILLDVREPFELDIARIEGSLAIPMREVPERLDELPRDKPVLVHCHHGGRSLQVTRYLQEHGFERVSNVAGGIDAWAERVDPKLQRY